MEIGIINLVGAASTGLVFLRWGAGMFEGEIVDGQEKLEIRVIKGLCKPFVHLFDLASTFIYFMKIPSAIELEWDGYKTDQDLLKIRPGKHEIFV